MGPLGGKRASTGAKASPQISGSKTMPQLCYTSQDIHEQYLGTNSLRREQAADAKRRARSSGAGDRKSSDASRVTNCNCNDDESRENTSGDYGESQVNHDASCNNRRKRSRSLSLFSNCFSISNISSMLSSSSAAPASTSSAAGHQHQGDSASGTQRVSRRRQFLAQLGLASGQPAKRRRPISASHTAGNLQQAADWDTANSKSMHKRDSPSPSMALGGRKHVSFGANQRLSPQAASAAAPDSSNQPRSIPHQQPARSAPPQQSARTNPISGASNNVIIRNYQANISAHLMPTANGCGKASGLGK